MFIKKIILLISFCYFSLVSTLYFILIKARMNSNILQKDLTEIHLKFNNLYLKLLNFNIEVNEISIYNPNNQELLKVILLTLLTCSFFICLYFLRQYTTEPCVIDAKNIFNTYISNINVDIRVLDVLTKDPGQIVIITSNGNANLHYYPNIKVFPSIFCNTDVLVNPTVHSTMEKSTLPLRINTKFLENIPQLTKANADIINLSLETNSTVESIQLINSII